MLTNRRSGAEPDKQLPPWLDPEAGLGLVPHLTVLARVLCVAIGTRDRALIDDLDQAETGFQGFSPSEDERAQIALGRCLGKSYEVPETFDRFKQLLVKSGVKDWDLFVDHVGRPYAREFGVEIAGFREKSEYRWVETKALPIPHELIKGRLPEGGLEMWDDLRVVRRSFGRTKNRSDSEIRDLWVAYYRQNWPLDWSRLDAPWDVIVERVEEFWQLPDSQWSSKNLDRFARSLDDRVAHGVRSVLNDPIIWPTDRDMFGNGQHRSLALLVAGVEKVLVSAS